MAGSVVSLHGLEIASPGDPDQEVIDHLEDLLARAKAGEVIAIMTVTCNADASVGNASLGNTLSANAMVGELEMLKYRTVKALED